MKTNTIFKRILAVILLFNGLNLYSQVLNVSPFLPANNDLRAFLIGLQFPANSDRFYDMTVQLANKNYYTNYYAVPNDLDHWLLMYEEMYYASYDSTYEPPVIDVLDALFPFNDQEVPVMVMNYNFHEFSNYANQYDPSMFIIDSVAQTIIDNPSRTVSPYNVENVFTGMQYQKEVYFRDVKFRIDPQFIFTDGYNASDFEILEFQINFGDGTGFHTINTSTLNTISVTYPAQGTYTIHYQIYDRSLKANPVIKYSTSQITITTDDKASDNTPDNIITYGGLNIGVYGPCDDIPIYQQKAFIYLTGFDMFNSESLEKHYARKIKRSGLDKLRQYGHTIYVIKYDDVFKPLQANATDVLEFLIYLKCNVYGESVEQFTVMGHSMGGLIGRYALLLGENFPQPPGTCEPQRKHNTRLFISADAPQQGANVPLALQWVWRDAGAILNAFPMLSTIRYALTYKYPPLLSTPAVQQMLLYHVDFPGALAGIYGRHALGDALFDEMNLMGGYPQHCKNIALAYGSLDGYPQQDSNMNPLPPNYRFLDLEMETHVRIFGNNYKVLDANTELRATPLFAGNLCEINLLEWIPKPKISLFGITVTLAPAPGNLYLRTAIGTPPVCSMNGSTISSLQDGLNLVKNFGMSFGNTLPGLLLRSAMDPLNMSFSGESDAGIFNFIPTISAIDYESTWTPMALGTNLEASCGQPIHMSSPFDVVVGLPGTYGVGGWAFWNEDHSIPPYNYTDDHFGGALTDMPNGFLVREIGDDRLQLDNYESGWGASFSAFRDVTAGLKAYDGNYWYPSDGCSVPSGWIPGSYSKEEPMNTGGYYVNFIHDHSGSFTDIGVVGTNFYDVATDMTFCDGMRLRPEEAEDDPELSKGEQPYGFYPNPAGEEVYITGLSQQNVLVEVYAITGEKIFEKTVNESNNHIRLPRERMVSGLYQMRMIRDGKPVNFKIVVD